MRTTMTRLRPVSLRPNVAVFGLLVAGAVLRLLYFAGVSSAIMPSNDSGRYLNSAFAPDGLFTDFLAPSGYPLFLRVVGWLPDRGAAIPIVQHLLGLVTAYGVWVLGRRIARRLDISEWWAVPGVAFVALSGDLVYFEHAIMTETLAIALLVGLALLAERLTRPDQTVSIRAWIGLGLMAGLVLAVSYTVRSVAGPTGVVLLATSLIWRRGMPVRLIAAAAVAVTAVGGVVAYSTIAEHSKGGKTGFGGMDGWYLYARTSSFAQCSKIHPPKDLRSLCDRTPLYARKGVYAYVYRFDAFPVQTPAVRRFKFHPNGNDELREFGLDAIRAQPLAYIKTVVKDLSRYIAPNAGVIPPYSGPGPEFLRISSLQAGGVSPAALHELDIKQVQVGPLAQPLEAWGSVTRMPPFLVILAVLLPLCALVRSRTRETWALLFPLWFTAVATAAAPMVLMSYEYRYGLPSQVLLAVITPLAVGVLVVRRRRGLGRSDGGEDRTAAEPHAAQGE